MQLPNQMIALVYDVNGDRCCTGRSTNVYRTPPRALKMIYDMWVTPQHAYCIKALASLLSLDLGLGLGLR